MMIKIQDRKKVDILLFNNHHKICFQDHLTHAGLAEPPDEEEQLDDPGLAQLLRVLAGEWAPVGR